MGIGYGNVSAALHVVPFPRLGRTFGLGLCVVDIKEAGSRCRLRQSHPRKRKTMCPSVPVRDLEFWASGD